MMEGECKHLYTLIQFDYHSSLWGKRNAKFDEWFSLDAAILLNNTDIPRGPVHKQPEPRLQIH